MNKKNTFILVLVSMVLIVSVNIAANYQSYTMGGGWHYSIAFVICITSLGWLLGMPLGRLMKKLFSGPLTPVSKILIAMLVLTIHGTVLMVGTMKAMVLLFHVAEHSTSAYITNTYYSVLFSLIIGLMIGGQQLLTNLKKSADDNERMKEAMLRSQYEALKNQVNPHFLFNSLNTLTVMIPTQPDLAVKFVEQMSKVFRYSLQNSAENTIDVATELKVVRSFLFLNEQRFEGKLHINIRVDDAVLERHIITQSLLMLAENAIKHNEISTSKPLTITISNDDKYLFMENTLQRRTQIEASTNIGLDNIKQRYTLVSGMPVLIEQTNDTFTVKLPLI